MPGCCVPHCTNSTEKGFSMRRFPSNLQRRTIWVKNINNQSSEWRLTKNSYVCETHFSAEMWEKVRVDGKRRLKNNAVPIIFHLPENGGISTSDFFPIEIPSTSSSKRLLTDIDTIDTNAINNAKRLQKSTIDEVDVPTDDSKILASDNIKGPRRNLDETSKKFETIIRKQDRTINILRQRIRQLRNSIQLLNKQRPQILLAPKFLQKVFNKDQIEYLKAKYEGRHIYKWTGETIKKALRLKHACGDNGYKELLRQCFPLPAIRTLRNRLECISFKDGICDEVFDLLKEKVSNFPDERHSDCMICVDEMSLTPGE